MENEDLMAEEISRDVLTCNSKTATADESEARVCASKSAQTLCKAEEPCLLLRVPFFYLEADFFMFSLNETPLHRETKLTCDRYNCF